MYIYANLFSSLSVFVSARKCISAIIYRVLMHNNVCTIFISYPCNQIKKKLKVLYLKGKTKRRIVFINAQKRINTTIYNI